MSWLIHVANLLILCSFLARDILWLRVLSITGGFAFIAYFALALPEPMWAPVGWNLVFTVINVVQIAVLLRERRPAGLDAQETALHRAVFAVLTEHEFKKIVRVARWRDVHSEVLAEQGKDVPVVTVLCDGRADVYVDGARVAALAPGTFVGELAYLRDKPASASVLTRGAARVVQWDRDVLRKVLDGAPDLSAKVQGVMGLDVAAKLLASPQSTVDQIRSVHPEEYR